MTTKEKKELTPEERAERRRRAEMRKRREQEMKKKKQKRALLVAALGAAALVVLTLLGIVIYKLANGGSKEISAKGSQYVIALDAGHGGEDIGLSNGAVLEKDVTASICSKLKTMLESQGCQVVLTHEENTRAGKEARVSAANGAVADLLVSVHCSYSEDSTISGIISHYKADSKESRLLAENIQSYLVKESKAEDAGFREGSYTIITDSEMPAVLVEAGYLSNTQETEALSEDTYQNDVAKGIAKGILASLVWE